MNQHAAANAYSWNKKLNKSEKILIFDLGGGTFDISLFKLSRRYIWTNRY